MFAAHTNSYDDNMLRVMFPPQARPCDMALKIPSKNLHFRSLANAMGHVRLNLAYVLDALQRWDDSEWPLVEDTVARELSAGTIFMGGIMDGIVILEMPDGQLPTPNMSFERHPFNDLTIRAAQESAKHLRSMISANQPKHADIWTLVNFWKHYLPYQPRPSVFDRSGNVRDFMLALGDGNFSGPIITDLIVPTFNTVCSIMRHISAKLNEPFDLDDLSLPATAPVSGNPKP